MKNLHTKIFSVVSQKGGVGKSTINIMLATNIVKYYKKKVMLIDTDYPQFSIVNKKEKELQTSLKNTSVDYDIVAVENVGDNLRNTIKEYYNKVDFIIIDFKGTVNIEMIKGLGYLDAAFLPLSFDDLEVDATISFYDTLIENFINDENKPLQIAKIFFNKYRKKSENHFEGLRDYLKEEKIDMLKNCVLDRVIYRERYRSLINPIPDNKENEPLEFKKLLKEIMSELKKLS